MTQEKVRLNKYLAQCGICSRRDADALIQKGKVLVNGEIAHCGMAVSGEDTILVSGKQIAGPDKKAYLLYYKPVGVTCSERDAHAEKLIMHRIHYPIRLTYAGRLDRESEGLMLLTNDGALINAMMRGANGHEKEYIVKVNKEITPDFLQKLSDGVYLHALKKKTRPARVEAIGKYTFSITITQGLNRQIRRMCGELGYQVLDLKRVRILNLEIGSLKPDEYRELSPEELVICKGLVGYEQ